MKKVTKFRLEKFQVARLKNLKKIIGGNNPTNGGNDDDTVYTTTGQDQDQDKDSSIRCTN